jgi:hypothetical protein
VQKINYLYIVLIIFHFISVLYKTDLNFKDGSKLTINFFDKSANWTNEWNSEPENRQTFIYCVNKILTTTELRYSETKQPTKLLIHSK